MSTSMHSWVHLCRSTSWVHCLPLSTQLDAFFWLSCHAFWVWWCTCSAETQKGKKNSAEMHSQVNISMYFWVHLTGAFFSSIFLIGTLLLLEKKDCWPGSWYICPSLARFGSFSVWLVSSSSKFCLTKKWFLSWSQETLKWLFFMPYRFFLPLLQK